MREKHLEKYLVEHSIKTTKESDFRGMQFNAIAESNKSALHTYKSLGFKEVGMIPQGFRLNEYSANGRPLVTVEKSTQYAKQVHLTKKLNTVGSPL